MGIAITGILSRVREQGKKSVQKEKLTYCIEASLPAARRRTKRRAQASCWAAAFCMYKMLHERCDRKKMVE